MSRPAGLYADAIGRRAGKATAVLLVSASAISLLERFQHANIAEAFVAPTTSVNRARFKPISAPNINGKNSAHRERRLPDCIGLPLRRARLDSLFMSSSAQGDKDQGDEGDADEDGELSEDTQELLEKIKGERQRLEDDWIAGKLRDAYDRNPNVAKKVDLEMAKTVFDERQEALLKEGEKIKENFERDARRAIQELDEEFERAVSVMNMRISSIIQRGRANITRSLEMTDGVPFPPDAASRLAMLDVDDDDAFYEQIGVVPPSSLREGREKVLSPEEREKMDAEVIALPPDDVIKEAAARVAAIARRNATLSASAARREAQAAGHVVVIGAGDGDLGARVVDLFAEDVALEEKGAGGVQSVEGVSLAEARAIAAGSGAGGAGTGRISVVKAALERVKTLVILPSDPGPKGPSGGGAGLAGMFGGGSGNQGGVEALSDADAAGVIEACGEGLKNIICLSVGVSSGGGVGAALFGTGGEDSKGFPAQSDAEQGVLRKAKAKGLSYVAVRASQFNKSPRKTTSPLVIPKNAPRPAKVPDASRAVVAEAIMRSSYQPESRRNSTFAIADFPESPGAWPVAPCGWADEFVKLSGPELYRVPIPAELPSGASGTLKAWTFLREWGNLWTKEGSGLTTRVRVFTDDDARRLGLYFDPSAAAYLSPEEEKKAEERRKELEKQKGASGPSRSKTKASQEGGVDIVVEDKPYARVRVMRSNMGPNTIVKEMSENTILEKLKKDVKQYIISPKKRKL